MRNIDKYLEIAEDADWGVYTEEFEDGCGIDIDFGWETTRMQDFHMNISINQDDPLELMAAIYKYWYDFDPEEEAMIWINPSIGKGANGAPESIIDIIKDMQEAKDKILELYNMMEGKVWDADNINVFNKNYKCALEELLQANHDEASPKTVNLIRSYDLNENYYGDLFLLFGRKKIEVESIFVEGEDAMLHVAFEAFEADVKMVNLSEKNIKLVMKFLRRIYMNQRKEQYYK